ncbi:MAG TPA: CoA transferase [Caulobacteraceae bacterium]|jgi:crotonobetainyl-CoA:carnitine CoA-transferase CaiB-like acyl-CoA transferase|nr:CoA transferase [Caulobacteraceae bacterium]
MLLAGLKVVEMSTWIAAPGCAMIMAEWGADVVKVEPPGGDAIRRFYPDTPESPGNPIFSLENRGKRGVVLDIYDPEGRAALVELLKGADVFITNLRPGALARTRLDYASLADELPRLIYAIVTSFGLEGDDADRPAFDLTGFWTRSGIAAATIPPDQEPFTCRPGFGDHVTALATLSGVLAAVHERAATGKGRLVEASLLRAGVYALGWDTSIHLRYGEATTAQARRDRPSAISGYFRVADGRYVCVAPRGPGCVPAVLRGLGLGHVLDEPGLGPPYADLDQVRRLRAMVDEAFAKLTMEEAGAMLTEGDLIWAPMSSLEEVAIDPQARAAGCFVVTPDNYGGAFEAPATPIRFPGLEVEPRTPAPQLGQHTRQVLEEAGIAADVVARLAG